MDDYFFRNHVKACRNVAEDTSYLEIFNYSVRNCLTISPRIRWLPGSVCSGLTSIRIHLIIPSSNTH